jgi:hypothetical protein
MGLEAGTLGQIALITQAGGAASSAVGTYFKSASDKSSLQTQAVISDTNARIAELSAQSALAQGQRQIGALTLKAGQLKSDQRASLAANGVDLGEGSAAELQASTEIMKDVDVGTLTANSERTAWGYRSQAVNDSSQAAMDRANATSISPAGYAATSLLEGAGKVASAWYTSRSNRSNTSW